MVKNSSFSSLKANIETNKTKSAQGSLMSTPNKSISRQNSSNEMTPPTRVVIKPSTFRMSDNLLASSNQCKKEGNIREISFKRQTTQTEEEKSSLSSGGSTNNGRVLLRSGTDTFLPSIVTPKKSDKASGTIVSKKSLFSGGLLKLRRVDSATFGSQGGSQTGSQASSTPRDKKREKSNFIIKTKKAKKKVGEVKGSVNEDANCNFYSDAPRSDNESAHSSESKVSKKSDGSPSFLRAQSLAQDSCSNDSSFTSYDGAYSDYSPHSNGGNTSPLQPFKKSKFSQLKPGEFLIADDNVEEDIINADNMPDQRLDNNILDESQDSYTAFLDSPEPERIHYESLRPGQMLFPSSFRRDNAASSSDTSFEIKVDDKKAKKEMNRLKIEIHKKKTIKKIYEFIENKGKMLINQETYQKSSRV